MAAKLFLDDESFVPQARAAFAAHANRQIRLVAPFAIHYELPSTLLGAVRRARIDPRAAREALDIFLRLDLPIVGAEATSAGSLVRDAYGVAERLACSFYDAMFIALAERLGTQLLTAESKLYQRIKSRTERLLWLPELVLP